MSRMWGCCGSPAATADRRGRIDDTRGQNEEEVQTSRRSEEHRLAQTRKPHSRSLEGVG